MKRSFLLGLLVCTLLAAPLPLRAEQQSIRAAEPTPLLLLVSAPKGFSAGDSIARFLEAANQAVEERTDLVVRSAEQLGVSQDTVSKCPLNTRFSCWTRVLSREPSIDLSQLWVLSIRPTRGGGRRLQSILLDIAAADRVIRRGLSAEETEAEIFRGLLRTTAQPVDLSDAGALERYFHAAVADTFRARWEQQGHWGRYGRVRLDLDEDASQLRFGTTVVTQLKGGTLSISHVRPGTHSLVVASDFGTSFHRSLAVPRGQTQEIQVVLQRDSRQVTPWVLTGAILAVGASVVAAAAYTADRTRDFRPDPVAFVSAGERIRKPVSFLGPLSVGLASAGLFTAASSLLFSDAPSFPYLPIGVGLVAGSSSLAAMVAIRD